MKKKERRVVGEKSSERRVKRENLQCDTENMIEIGGQDIHRRKISHQKVYFIREVRNISIII